MKREMLSMRHASLATCLLLMGASMGFAWQFTVDDAFIAVRYAERLAGGLGYTFFGADASDGVTGPLWLLPLVAAAALGLPVLTVAKASSALASLVAAGWLVCRARRRALGTASAWWVATLCASSLPLAVWSVAGLETGLATLLVSWLVVATLDDARVQAGLAVALLAWLRPELALFAGVLLSWRRNFALALAGALSVLAFRWLMFGHLLPMTASAKPASLANGMGYLVDVLREPRVLLLGLLLPLVRGRSARVLALALAAHAGAVVLAGGDWMPARRLFVPVVPALAFVLAQGLRRVFARRPRTSWGALALVSLVSARELASELPVVREAGERRLREAPRLARAICAASPIALLDVGLIGALCPAAEIIDLAGLTSRAVAYARGGHLDKQIDEAWLRAQRPAALVLHSRERPRVDELGRLRWFAGYPVERRVLGFAFARDLRVHDVIAYAPSYYYVVLR
jgi:hypothetical protein